MLLFLLNRSEKEGADRSEVRLFHQGSLYRICAEQYERNPESDQKISRHVSDRADGDKRGPKCNQKNYQHPTRSRESAKEGAWSGKKLRRGGLTDEGSKIHHHEEQQRLSDEGGGITFFGKGTKRQVDGSRDPVP